jgi:hypothetical protein
LVGAKENSEVGTRPALPGAIYGVKLALAHNSRCAGKIQPPRLTRV